MAVDGPAVPGAVDAVLARSMQKRREDRYPTIGELLAETRRALSVRAASDAAVLGAGRAIALHVEVRLGPAGEDMSDDVLSDLDFVHAEVRRFAAEAGMSIALDAGNTVLAVVALARDPIAEMVTRTHVVNTAIALKEHREGRADGVSAALALHVGTVLTQSQQRQGQAEYVGGELFDFADWAEQGLDGKLIATNDALQGIESDFAHVPLETNPSLHEVTPT
jgi:serine/threonine-protein kinase